MKIRARPQSNGCCRGTQCDGEQQEGTDENKQNRRGESEEWELTQNIPLPFCKIYNVM